MTSANHDGAHKPDDDLLELETLVALMHNDITEVPPPVITTRVIRLFKSRSEHQPRLH
ncbi:MAG: hypothetical protein M1434_01140 [Chloroflexi bacterium]|nr:hypothetical protein [Chloroflexota bacterium]MCL5273336.1 hypothetical protein [Chloroflexota bacterium]